jgi:hypothetical protein
VLVRVKPPAATVGGVCVVEITVDVHVPKNVMSPALPRVTAEPRTMHQFVTVDVEPVHAGHVFCATGIVIVAFGG